MLLRSIVPEHFGPFSTQTVIPIERDVTVFTGANDTGKSCALAAIRMFCTQAQGAEIHTNMDRIGNHPGPWNTDKGVRIGADLEADGRDSDAFSGDIRPGDIVRCHYFPNEPGAGYRLTQIVRGGSHPPARGSAVHSAPRIVELSPDAIVRNNIDLSALTGAENQLLRLAFGPNFSPSAVQSLTAHSRAIHLDKAEQRLNSRMAEFFPGTLPLQFRLTDIGGKGTSLAVSLVDDAGGYTSIEHRGTGVKRLLALMGVILHEANPSTQTIVLLDEPETSLHADAQHQLRKVLEALATNPNMQVVYATHSPSMINPSQPARIRVFSRGQNADIATSTVSRISHGENFQFVRVSLGLTPADSLLYGLVSIFVEGDTEARCLSILLRRLDQEGIGGFEGLTSLLDSCHFVCSWGDSISYYCNLAIAQNAKPLVFLDGDKTRLAEKLRGDHLGIPVLELRAQTEFEQLVPIERYISALSDELGAKGVQIELSSNAFREWARETALPERMMFSKKIDRWIGDLTGSSYNKHAVMEAAIAATPIAEVDSEALKQLATTIRQMLA